MTTYKMHLYCYNTFKRLEMMIIKGLSVDELLARARSNTSRRSHPYSCNCEQCSVYKAVIVQLNEVDPRLVKTL